ncbi:helix-turn-helix domain-containing protein [Nitratifractor sp.]
MSDYLSSENPVVRQIEESLKLTRGLFISSVIIGEPHSGKRTLVRRIFPHLPLVDGSEERELMQMLEREQELIIVNFEAIPSPENLDLEGKRIVAIADLETVPEHYDRLFAFIYHMPPLRERPEDLPALREHFLNEARQTMQLTGTSDLNLKKLDLSSNFRSFRASIFREALLQELNAEELEEGLLRYFIRTLEGNNAYRENLGLLERPLLKAGLRRYRSQLKLAEVLGINRNTLRKKLHEYRID